MCGFSCYIYQKWGLFRKYSSDSEISDEDNSDLNNDFEKFEERKINDLVSESSDDPKDADDSDYSNDEECKSIDLNKLKLWVNNETLQILSASYNFPIKTLRMINSNWDELSISDEDINRFFSLLAKWGKKTQKFFSLANFTLSGERLSELIKASCNSETVQFFCCKIDTSSTHFDFVIPHNYQISQLNFTFWGKERLSNWAQNLEQLESLIVAIAKSGLKHSLSWIDFKCWDLEEDVVNAMFQKYELGHIGFSV